MRKSQNPNPSNLEKIRREAGLSRKKLGELSGVDFRCIEKYEQGVNDINIASVKIVLAIAHALNVPIENILNDEEPENEGLKNYTN